MSFKVAFYFQHLLGIGHFRRAVTLAQAMKDGGLDVTAISGGAEVPGLRCPCDRFVQLPPIRALDVEFRTLVDENGRPVDDALLERRRNLAVRSVTAAEPHVLLIEGYPFGRRRFSGEIDTLIAAARRIRPGLAVLGSVRDILVHKDDPVRDREIIDKVRNDFDAILVHGDPRVVTLEDSFPPARAIAEKLRYTGYVSAAPPSDVGTAPSGEVIVSAGGGAVGERLLRSAIAARAKSDLAALPWRLLSGFNLPDAAYDGIADSLPAGMAIERFRADFPVLLQRCALSISQAGYNTILELLRVRARAVVVPFAAGAETEQTLRAQILARRRILHVVAEDELDDPSPGAGLARAINRAIGAPPPAQFEIDLDGAARTARYVETLAAKVAANEDRRHV